MLQAVAEGGASIGDIRITGAESRHKIRDVQLFVVDEAGRLTGTITFPDLHEAAFDTSHDGEWVASSVAREHPAVLKLGDDLAAAVEVFGASGEVHLPVVADAEDGRMLGVAHEHEIMLTYHLSLIHI